MSTDGLRFTDGKVRFDLLPPDAILALAEHYTRGAVKYEPRNWEKGMDWSKCEAPLMRHLSAWQRGEDYDAETGSHHMIAVAWNALALFVYAARGLGKDDRVRLKTAKTQQDEEAEQAASGPGLDPIGAAQPPTTAYPSKIVDAPYPTNGCYCPGCESARVRQKAEQEVLAFRDAIRTDMQRRETTRIADATRDAAKARAMGLAHLLELAMTLKGARS